MATQVETAKDQSFSQTHTTVDPEVDAEDALQTLRQFVLEDLPDDAPPLKNWHGLDAYIEELCAYGIDRLTREPDDLNAASLRLKNDLEDVACGNYRALIESFECAGAVREGVTDVRTHLDQMVVSLPELADATRRFSSSVNAKQQERTRRLRAISEHRAISDILEMPRLMSTLISAELYDEALELRENAVKLAAMHPDERLICGVREEVDILTQQMVLQLLLLLRKSVQLPMCLRVVGFLRLLGVFSEFRLRMLFLHCRGEWMRSGVESSSAPTRQAQLVALSDNTRAMIFEIITQYRAVFNDDEEDEIEYGEAFLANGKSAEARSKSSAILFDWTSSCIADYLQRLQDGIKDITDGAALNTVLQQSMYCGQSLGRVGADFRATLPPLFQEAVMRIYNSHLNAALHQFEMMIEDDRWAPVGSSALRKERGGIQKSVERLATSGEEQTDKSEMSVDDGHFAPPLAVLDSPPLAVFLNGILAALNELRLCAPVSLGSRLGTALQETLISAGEYMSAIGGPGGAFLKRSDRPHFLSMSSSLRDLCVPHAARCLDHCLDKSGLVPVTEVQDKLNDIFGDTEIRVSLSSETEARLNGTSEPQEVQEGGEENPGENQELQEEDGYEKRSLSDAEAEGTNVDDRDSKNEDDAFGQQGESSDAQKVLSVGIPHENGFEKKSATAVGVTKVDKSGSDENPIF